MAQPTSYTPATDFSAEETASVGGRSTVRTAALDAEFDAIRTTLTETLANLSLNQRDDGEIRDARVKLHTLSTDVRALLTTGNVTSSNLKGAWLTATAYVKLDLVVQSGNTYICAAAHTSGTFATDLAASKWILVALGASPGASNVAFTSTALVPSTNVQDAIELLSTQVEQVADSTRSIASESGTLLAGATVITLTTMTYIPGVHSMAVKVNGTWLLSSQYTETNSTTITLSTPYGVNVPYEILASTMVTDGVDDAQVSIRPGDLARTLDSLLSEEIRVTDYTGCDRTGTSDSTAAFQAAAAAALVIVTAYPNRGVRIIVPPGEYLLSGTVTIGDSNIVIEGSGRFSSVIKVTTSFRVFDFFKSGGAVIRYGGVRHLGMRSTSGANLSSGSFIRFYNMTGGIIDDCHLQGWYNGIEWVAAARCMIDNVALSQSPRTSGAAFAGILITGDSVAGVSTGNHIKTVEMTSNSSVVGPYAHAIYCTSADGLYIENSHWTNGTNGLVFNPDNSSGNDRILSVIVEGTYMDACEGRNLYIQGDTTASGYYVDIKFGACIFRAGKTALVTVATANSASTVKSLSFENCTFRVADWVGVTFTNDYVQSAGFVNCTWEQNNTTGAASGHDITIRGENALVSHCRFMTGNAVGSCVFIASTATRTHLVSNDFTLSTRGSFITNNAPANKAWRIVGNRTSSVTSVLEEHPTKQTTDATPTVLWSYTLADDEAIALDADVFAMSASISSGTEVHKKATYYKDGAAAPVLIGTQTTLHAVETAAGYDAVISITGNTVQVVVTGLAASTITWVANIRAILRGA